MKVARGPAAWARRAFLAAVLIAAAVIPGRASSQQAQHCTGVRCTTAGSILWTRALGGSWLAQPGVPGTVPNQAAAYASAGGGLAVVGTRTSVTALAESTGKLDWQVSLTGFPAGSAIVGVRAFAGVVAVGVEPPAGQAIARREVILSAVTGAQLRAYPAALYGGAVAAARGGTVIVGNRAVTDYANRTGRVIWSRSTGAAGQTWRVSAGDIYVTEGSGGFLAGSGVTAVREISLADGAERIIRSAHTDFPGTLTEVSAGDLVFSGADGVRAYSGTGRLLWSRAAGDVELADSGQPVVYVASGSRLLGIDGTTGEIVSRSAISVAASLYWVVNGVALGLDRGGLGEAWGYNLASRRIVWSSTPIPWPHFFVDLSGLGGSASPSSDVVLMAACAQVGSAARPNSAPGCRRPELAAVLMAARPSP